MKKFDKLDWTVLLIAAGLLWVSLKTTSQPPTPDPTAAVTSTATTDTKPDAKAADGSTPDTKPADPAKPTESVKPAVEEKLVVLKNSVAEFTFSSLGGGIKTVDLLAASLAGKTKQQLNERPVAAIGSLANGSGEFDNKPWAIVAQTEKSITFEATVKGVTVQKIWSMRDGEKLENGPGYLWDLKLLFKNPGTEKFTADDFYLYTGASHQISDFTDQFLRSVYKAEGKSVEIDRGLFDASKRLWVLWETRPQRSIIEESFANLTWAGTTSQYYATLVSPMQKVQTKIWSKWTPDEFLAEGKLIRNLVAMHTGLGIGSVKVEPNATQELAYEVFVGPRSATLLSNLEGERQDAMFYGMFGFISKVFLRMLNFFNAKTHSFGLAIVFLTIIVRFAIWPLSLKAYRSMKKMGKLAPMMNLIKEKYKARPQTPENQQKQQLEMMGLYKEYNVSPLGGCLPILLQMPIFFGYFGMLNHAVEMRGHSFLWAHDLSRPDTVWHIFGFPLNPLPLVMTITMFIQMKLTPMTTPGTSTGNDAMAQQMAMQQKMFKFMPLLFLVFCYGNPSALALYWTVQNIVSIFQSWIQKKMPEPELTKRAVKVDQGGVARKGLFGFNQQTPAQLADSKDKGPKPPRPGGNGKSAYKEK